MQLCKFSSLAYGSLKASRWARLTSQQALHSCSQLFRSYGGTGSRRLRAGTPRNEHRTLETPSSHQPAISSPSVKELPLRTPWAGSAAEGVAKEVEGNQTNLQLSFLGTASSHRHPRHKLCVALRTRRSCFLFECCEDTQRALLSAPHIRPSRIDRIFISCLDGDQMYGLPGMLCSVSAGREEGHGMSDLPVHVYGPAGLAAFVNAALEASDTFLLMPVIVHEYSLVAPDVKNLTSTEVAGWQPEYEMINRRARLFHCLLPPDQLHPVGHYDGSPQPLNTRRRLGGGRMRGLDERSGLLPLPLPPPGNPAATVKLKDATWTICSENEYTITATAIPRGGLPCLAYTFHEADRTGTLDPDEAMRLGAKPGKNFSEFKAGRDVELADGTVVRSSDVLGPRRYGRAIVIMAQSKTPIPPSIALGLVSAPLLVAPAYHQGVSIATEMGQLAEQLGSKEVFVTCCGEDRLPATASELAVEGAITEATQALSQHTSARVYAAKQFGVLNVAFDLKTDI